MKLRKNKVIEREAINATRVFFEANGCIFQEVDTGNDYGKDAYVDFANKGDITGMCAALQIKGGKSYKRKSGYGIPIERHLDVWRSSTLPIIGIVYDPEDKCLRWSSISKYLDNIGEDVPSYIPVSADAILTSTTLRFEFKQAIERFSKLHTEHPVVQLCSKSATLQLAVLYDCFALGRSDARVLIALRYLTKILTGKPLLLAISILSHVTPHPDIMWNKHNWIPKEVTKDVRPHLVWDTQEIWNFLSCVTWNDWQRGNRGEDLYMLLMEDPQIKMKMESVAVAAINVGDEEVAFSALYLTVYWAGNNGVEKYQQMLSKSKDFRKLPLTGELEQILRDCGYISLF